MNIKKVLYRHYRLTRPHGERYNRTTNNIKNKPSVFDLLRASRRRTGEFANVFLRVHGVFPRGGMTECTLVLDNGDEIVGRAICSMNDGFCKRTGREIAYERAIEQLGKL